MADIQICIIQLYIFCLLYTSRGVKAGYAKFETFPIWNLPLKHPVNLAYEAATADLNDVNMIDPFHLEAYGKTTVNYNRDVEVFPVVQAMFEKIMGSCPYKSPTDMGVNMAGNCIIDDEVCQEASRQEIIQMCIRDSFHAGKKSTCFVYPGFIYSSDCGLRHGYLPWYRLLPGRDRRCT